MEIDKFPIVGEIHSAFRARQERKRKEIEEEERRKEKKILAETRVRMGRDVDSWGKIERIITDNTERGTREIHGERIRFLGWNTPRIDTISYSYFFRHILVGDSKPISERERGVDFMVPEEDSLEGEINTTSYSDYVVRKRDVYEDQGGDSIDGKIVSGKRIGSQERVALEHAIEMLDTFRLEAEFSVLEQEPVIELVARMRNENERIPHRD